MGAVVMDTEFFCVCDVKINKRYSESKFRS